MASSAQLVAVIAHLSGRYRGKIQRLDGQTVTIGTEPDAGVRFSVDDLTPELSSLPETGPYAVLQRAGDSYKLTASLEADVWINGRRVEQRLLESGDVLELGEGGPVLRFRLYPANTHAYKSIAEVFSDCAECVKHTKGPAQRAMVMVAQPPAELLTRTSPWVRIATLVLLAALTITVGMLWNRSRRLEQRIQDETRVISGLSELLERGESQRLSPEDIEILRNGFADSLERIEQLEARSDARARVIAASARSVMFIQGSWGFVDEEGSVLRFVGLDEQGLPLRDETGPLVTVDGDGPPIEVLYTGTAFVVSPHGHLLTNRHVAEPWEYDDITGPMREQGLQPTSLKLVGYLPGIAEGWEIKLVASSTTLDVSLMQGELGPAAAEPLQLASAPARPGDDVIVMGYPTGMNALVARADPEVVEGLRQAGDFWDVGSQLAAANLIEPLATVGVVGQISPTAVVYDAETTHGGSGGPVLDLEGRVLAVNAAILPEFGGSNLGVPAAEARLLLAEVWDP